MTQEDKELLLKDLCARLPYGVKAHTKIGTNITVIGIIDDIVKDETEDSFDISLVKPYLRPMSSMTEEEQEQFIELTNNNIYFVHTGKVDDYVDLLVAHHFDYRGLIPMGLAIEAPEGMYLI